jgi:hypothetical protein
MDRVDRRAIHLRKEMVAHQGCMVVPDGEETAGFIESDF